MNSSYGQILVCQCCQFRNDIVEVWSKCQQYKKYAMFQFGWLGCQKYVVLLMQ
jgi:hypothetical protein